METTAKTRSSNPKGTANHREQGASKNAPTSNPFANTAKSQKQLDNLLLFQTQRKMKIDDPAAASLSLEELIELQEQYANDAGTIARLERRLKKRTEDGTVKSKIRNGDKINGAETVSVWEAKSLADEGNSVPEDKKKPSGGRPKKQRLNGEENKRIVNTSDGSVISELHSPSESLKRVPSEATSVSEIVEKRLRTIESVSLPKKHFSDSPKVTINDELKNLLPPPTEAELEHLREQLINEGCRDAFPCWNDNGNMTIVDGHHRHEICKEENIAYTTVEEPSIHSLEEAKIWIIIKQSGQRNLNRFQQIEVSIKRAEIRAAQAKINQLSGLHQSSSVCLNSDKRSEPIDITQDVADFANVGRDTASRVIQIIKYASPEDIRLLETEKKSINAVYNSLEKKGKLQKAEPAFTEKSVGSINSKTHDFVPELALKKFPSGNMREMKIKDLVDKDEVLFMCIKSPVQGTLFLATTSKGIAPLEYNDWIRLVKDDHNQNGSIAGLIANVQERIEKNKQTSKK